MGTERSMGNVQLKLGNPGYGVNGGWKGCLLREWTERRCGECPGRGDKRCPYERNAGEVA